MYIISHLNSWTTKEEEGCPYKANVSKNKTTTNFSEAINKSLSDREVSISVSNIVTLMESNHWALSIRCYKKTVQTLVSMSVTIFETVAHILNVL